jgi:hypothetical protein
MIKGRKFPRRIANCRKANSIFLLQILVIKKRAKRRINRNITPSNKDIEAGIRDCGGYSQRPFKIQ